MASERSLSASGKVLIFGASGLVGSAICRKYREVENLEVLSPSSMEVNLLNRSAVRDYIAEFRPSCIIDAAGKVGGINANNTLPSEFLSLNLQMQLNLFESALEFKTSRFIFLGSSCIYPRNAHQPIAEESLLTGILEETNKPYAIAKIAGITHIQAIRRQFGLNYISVMPTNLYGPFDNFESGSSHVLPGLIGKFTTAVKKESATVDLWGDGTPLREFLHVDDLARAIYLLDRKYDDITPINVGSGVEISIKELANIIAKLCDFSGEIIWNNSMPNGTPRKLLDSSRIKALGWQPEIDLLSGLKATIDWYLKYGSK